MNLTDTVPTGSTANLVVLAAVVVGALLVGYGLVLVPQSTLGGVHVAVIGGTLALSGLFETRAVGDRFGLSPRTRRTFSLAFAVIALLLVLAFVVLQQGTFDTRTAQGVG